MQWARVKYDIDGATGEVPFSFIEDSLTKQVLENSKRNVFWSSNAKVTPESILQKQGKIAYVDQIKRNTSNKRRIPGYYSAIILRIEDSWEELQTLLKRGRTSVTRASKKGANLTSEKLKTDSVKHSLKSRQANVDSLLHACDMNDLTAIVHDSRKNCTSQLAETLFDYETSNTVMSTERDSIFKCKRQISNINIDGDNNFSENDDSLNEDYVARKVQKISQADDMKLIAKDMFHVQQTPSPTSHNKVITNNISQNEEYWQMKYNAVQQENENLTNKVKYLTDLNVDLQVEVRALQKQASVLKSTMDKCTSINSPKKAQSMTLSHTIISHYDEMENSQSGNNLSSIDTQELEYFSVAKEEEPPKKVYDENRTNTFAESVHFYDSSKVNIISKQQFLAANKNLFDGKNHDSRFIKTICDLQWTRNEMVQRTAKLAKSNNTMPMCTPAKINYMKSLLDKRMDEEKIPPNLEEREKRKLEVETYVCSKFSTIRRNERKRRQKEENKCND